MPAEPTIETIAEELSVVYDIIIDILERYADGYNEQTSELHRIDILKQLEKAKAHTETAFETFDKLGLVNY